MKMYKDCEEYNGCPLCASEEVESNSPRTKYKCGTTTYDDRPNSFNIGKECLSHGNQLKEQ